MLDSIRNFHQNVGKNPIFRFWIALCSIVAYGFSLTNRTISIDGLSDDLYYYNPKAKSGVISGKRWGYSLYRYLFSTHTGVTSTDRIVAVIFAILASILICMLLYSLSKKPLPIYVYLIVASTYITYPLINEISEYPGTYAYIGIEFCTITVAILIQVAGNHSLKVRNVIAETLLLSIVTSGYESGIFAYITFVLLVLTIESINSEDSFSIKEYAIRGIRFAIPLVFATLIKYLLGYTFIWLSGAYNGAIGSTQILWRNGAEWAWTVIKTNIYLYFARGFLYFPIGLFVAVTTITFLSLLLCKKNRIFIIISYFLALLSTFGQSILQCNPMPYRTAQSIWIFTVVSVYMVAAILNDNVTKSIFIKIFIVAMLFIDFRQSVYLNELLSWNNLRSENEADLAKQIGYRIVSECDNSKPVVVVGTYYEGSWIKSALTVSEPAVLIKLDNWFRKSLDLPEVEDERPVDTNVRSYLSWGVRALGMEDLEVLKWYFSYWGYDINIIKDITSEEKERYAQVAKEIGMSRFEVRELEEYIIVNLG